MFLSLLILRILALAAGVLVVLATWQSIVVTIILPRRSRNWLAAGVWLATYYLVMFGATRLADARRRDAALSFLGPTNIVLLLFVWMSCFALGFGLLFWSFGDVSLGDAFDLAGSSIFTLGFATAKAGGARIVMFLAAASGIVVVGLQIGYLPTIYSAYSQREALVTLLNMRCQENGALSGATILKNHPLPRARELLGALFGSWEACAAAIVESHTNYPWLIVFRSPRPSESWITSMLGILDAIALLRAVAPDELPIEGEHCHFACKVALSELARMVIPKPALPARTALSERDFRAALDELRDAVPRQRDDSDAWRAFCAERSEYERSALILATFVDAPEGGWLRPIGAIEAR